MRITFSNTLNVVVLGALLVGCGGDAARAPEDFGPAADDPIWSTPEGKEDTSATGWVRRIEWEGFVLVPTGSDTGTAQWHVRRQIKSALGALRTGPAIALRDRDARSNLDPATFTRETLDVRDGATVTGKIDRVRYRYQDLALVPRAYRPSALSAVLLFDDYAARHGELAPSCADEAGTEADSFWYHYMPSMSACARVIKTEQDRINLATAALGATTGVIAKAELDRRFITVRATLGPQSAPPVTYPEYDRLWGFGTDRTKVVVYSFFGVDADDRNVHDNGLVEALRYVRTMRAAFPKLGVTETRPFALMLDFKVDGQPVPNVTYEQLASWVIDGKDWPAQASDAGKQQQLLDQARDKFLERWVVWQLPVTVKRGGETRSMTVELRTYYGREDGQEDWRLHARWRYLEAFWHGDVFSYTGHSHFGHGPLEPTGYGAGNFPDRYQVMLFNSCLSYNYYDVDFLEMHPGGTKNVEVVSNGLAAYWTGMGESTARYVLGLLDGQNRSWGDVIGNMAIRVPWSSTPYDPMRAVNGELDNGFAPAAGKVELVVP
jgi:hypothetical protein